MNAPVARRIEHALRGMFIKLEKFLPVFPEWPDIQLERPG